MSLLSEVGLQATRGRSVESVRRGGKIGFTGLHEAESALHVNTIIHEEFKLFGAFAYSAYDFETALQWIAEDGIPILSRTEHRPLHDAQLCFEKLISGPGDVAKIILHSFPN